MPDDDDDDLDLDALLAGLGDEPATEAEAEADDADLDALLAGLGDEPATEAEADDADLDALLAGLGDEPATEPAAEAEADDADLDALLSGLTETPEPEADEPEPPPKAIAIAPKATVVAPKPNKPTRVPPDLEPAPADISVEQRARWEGLNAAILASWGGVKAQGTFWFTLVGRQDRPVVLLDPADGEPNRVFARKDNDVRNHARSGYGKYMRNDETLTVRLMLVSGIGTPDARAQVLQTLDAVGYFAGYATKF